MDSIKDGVVLIFYVNGAQRSCYPDNYDAWGSCRESSSWSASETHLIWIAPMRNWYLLTTNIEGDLDYFARCGDGLLSYPIPMISIVTEGYRQVITRHQAGIAKEAFASDWLTAHGYESPASVNEGQSFGIQPDHLAGTAPGTPVKAHTATKNVSKAIQPSTKGSKIAQAIALKYLHPHLTRNEIAERVGCKANTLSQDKNWVAICKYIKEMGRASMPRGSKDRDGRIEAEDR